MRWLILLLLPTAAQADSVVATRQITAGALVTARDVALVDMPIPDALGALADAIGQTARVTVYAGRALRPSDLGPAMIVKRNQNVALLYTTGTLAIHAEGRALGTGTEGDEIRVLNTGSKTTITGRIMADGTIEVRGAPCAGC